MLTPLDTRRFELPGENTAGERIAVTLCLAAFALWASIVTPLAIEYGPKIIDGMTNVLKNP